jgi:N-acetylglucosaminyldiphosphoundecaprenol N-acetyl-beta-D-mannosaminyltransferase
MWEYLGHASTRQEPIYLIGGRPDTLEKLRLELLKEFPALKIAGTCSPPFRPLTDAETTAIIDEINASGARTVWVGLGCPTQETWMSMQKGKIHAVMFGVGAAFDFHARTTPRAPKWMQQKGLEWLFRLCSEPRRLWKRYFVTNSLFLWYAFIQLVGGKGHPPQNAR